MGGRDRRAREDPADDLLLIILPWVMSRFADPYGGVQREPNFENLWFGAIPGTQDGAGRVVVCSYFVFERDGLVRCDSFATLRTPL